jgi:hypothetical protein
MSCGYCALSRYHALAHDRLREAALSGKVVPYGPPEKGKLSRSL